MNYYNEIDPLAAAWLRELIKTGHIAQGEVDERSIAEVQPDDLRGFTQCHFFAGIGVWSYALRAAGWPDDTPVWTGSCPCQSFSASGKRGGFSDKRHLWPAWFRLLRERSPHTIFGEQVASNDGLAWFDVVSADLEGAGYAVGAADLCAAGFGAPHIRQRLYFVGELAHAASRCGFSRDRRSSITRGWTPEDAPSCGEAGRMADAQCDGGRADQPGREAQGRTIDGRDGEAGELGHAELHGSSSKREFGESQNQGWMRQSQRSSNLTNGFWADAEWLWCRDGKMRPTKPLLFPLATGIANRVGLLRGAGNSLTAPVAEGFIRAYLEQLGK